MSLEQNRKATDDARGRRASAAGTLVGMAVGLPLGVVLFFAAAWAWFTFALPHAAHRVFVAIDPEAPGRVVRAEIDGWPLTPRLAGTAGVEFALERNNRRRSELIVEMRRDADGAILSATRTIENRRCDVVVVFDAAGGIVSDCAYHFRF